MRKYQQLLLIIISTVSVCLVLIYRHEYLRLRYVLEVLNFFGTPPKKEDLFRRATHNHPDWGPEPLWHRVNNNFYIYSAHRNTENNHSEIKVLAIGPKSEKVPKFTCNFYFDGSESSLKSPQLGYFSYTTLSQIGDFTNYIFICKRKQIFNKVLHEKVVPYAISIQNSSLLFIRDTIGDKKLDFTVCVEPSGSVTMPDIIDFVSHYQVLGADHFIFYNNFVSAKLQRALDNVSSDINASFTVFPWNVPYQKLEQSLIDELITHDCLLRTLNTSKYVLILKINQLIVPKFSSNLLTVLDTLENAEDAQRFAMHVVKFCRTAMPLKNILLNTRYIKKRDDKELIIAYRNMAGRVTDVESLIRSVEVDVAELHDYIYCDLKEETMSDSSSMHYAARLNDAQLKILYDTGALF